jgi:dsDNA-specific endonuclease/ATPase MutS2
MSSAGSETGSLDMKKLSIGNAHGLGEGKLRTAIARRLKEMHEVSAYKNEYHPKYGWGATEVIFS